MNESVNESVNERMIGKESKGKKGGYINTEAQEKKKERFGQSSAVRREGRGTKGEREV